MSIHREEHGEYRTKLYRSWEAMKYRCLNQNCNMYKYYGGKGVTICSEWMHYSSFAEWARRNGYFDGLTIDRVDPNGNYEPDNCQWITMYDNIGKDKAKTYKFIDPDGEIREIHNLKRFCEANGLREQGLYRVANGTRKTYKNWRAMA